MAGAILMPSSAWICCGASPGLPDGLRAARSASPDATVIATNSAIDYFEPGELDYLFLSDAVAQEKWADTARRHQAAGTKLVTQWRHHRALKHRGVEHYDIFLEPINGPGATYLFVRGQYSHAQLSGIWTMQVALNFGATLVHVVGQEGYRGEHAVDYWHGAKGFGKGQRHTHEIIEPYMNDMCRNCPDVQFVFHGYLGYTVDQPNAVKGGALCPA